MFKIPDIPSPKAEDHEIADFIEIECLKNKQVSSREVFSSMSKLSDHGYPDGDKDDNDLEIKLNDVIEEINRRNRYCGLNYPFRIKRHGHVVEIKPDINEIIKELYIFLLFATRLDMKTNRVQGDIDGALLFEELAEYIGKHYFGDRTDSYGFGTATQGLGFKEKVDQLIVQMGEGGSFVHHNKIKPTSKKDDGLDIVIWKSFSDDHAGKLIGFGQCKTGTHWKEHLTRIQPGAFCKKWFRVPLAVDPVRLFFISESILRNRWHEQAVDGGILFDRCRLMDYLPKSSNPPFFGAIKEWNKAIKEMFLN